MRVDTAIALATAAPACLWLGLWLYLPAEAVIYLPAWAGGVSAAVSAGLAFGGVIWFARPRR